MADLCCYFSHPYGLCFLTGALRETAKYDGTNNQDRPKRNLNEKGIFFVFGEFMCTLEISVCMLLYSYVSDISLIFWMFVCLEYLCVREGESAESFFQSFLREVIVSSCGMG